MGTRILIIQGHPDAYRQHLCHSLAQAYADGARDAGHEVETVEPARLAFPLLSSPAEWYHGSPPPQLAAAQDAILRARHLVFVYPLWVGDMPALLKGFIEQVARPGFAVDDSVQAPDGHPRRAGLLRGRSARLVVSMGMAAPVYRWFHGAHGIKLMRRNILGYVGIDPVRTTLVGRSADLNDEQTRQWCQRMRKLGLKAA